MSPEAIIAVASGVQAVATVVLVGVTIRYVILTGGILRTSQAQLQDARNVLDASLKMSRDHLGALVAKIDRLVRPLPPVGVPVEALRRSGCWTESDEERLLELIRKPPRLQAVQLRRWLGCATFRAASCAATKRTASAWMRRPTFCITVTAIRPSAKLKA